MFKIKKLFSALSKIISQPSLLNLILLQNDNLKAEFLKKYPNLESLPQITLKELDENFNTEIDLFFLDGGSMTTDLALLKTLAKKKSVNNYFEIGTWRGESVWNVAKEIEDCTTLNLSNADILELSNNKKYADLHGFLSKNNPHILHLEGNTKTFDFKKLNKKYDLIFIDGDHTSEMVKNDTQKVFENLVHKDSIVVWHDYAFNPENIRYEVYKGILDGLPQDKHQNLYHVANTMCAVFISGKFTVKSFESPKEPEFLFQVNIKIKN